MRLLAALGLLVALALATVAAGPDPHSAFAADKHCQPYRLIGAQGSGEEANETTLKMGPEVYDLFVALRHLLGGGAALAGEGVDYPAVHVGWKGILNGSGAALHLGFLGEYTDSVREGRRRTEDAIRDTHRDCKDTRFILAGYSQGAQAVGDALQRMDGDLRRLVAAAAFFGDPYFNADSWSVRSDADPSLYGSLGVRPEWPEQLRGSIFSFCHHHDPVCNLSRRYDIGGGAVFVRDPSVVAEGFGTHSTPAYQSVANRGRGDADLAALYIATSLGASFPATSYTGPLDIVFVIDSTGSMVEEIDEIKASVSELVQQIAGVNPDFRVALVDYKDTLDEESEYQARLDLPFTTDFAAFDAALGQLEAEGGGDSAESVYSGLMTALEQDWRAGARKLVIVLGDAPAKDPEPVTGWTLRDVEAKALAVDPAAISPIQIGENEEASESFRAVATATSGDYLQLPESDLSALVPTIVGQVRRNAAAPVAALRTPSVAIAGDHVGFNAATSHGVGEPIASYDWDFTGDGSFDLSTTDPVASYVYPAPFTGTVVLRVRSASGLASLATAPLAVVPGAARRPGAPRKLRATLRRKKLVLRWSVGKGPLPRWFTIYGRRGKAVTRIPVRGLADPKQARRKRYAATVRGLRPGATYRYSVGAGNVKGESRRVGPVVAKVERPQQRKKKHLARR